MAAIILSAFALGLLGSLHCIGMCGPLVMSMPFQNTNGNRTWLSLLSYNAGKTTTYGLFGLIAGSIGQGFAMFKWQQTLSVVAGCCLLLLTLLPFLKNRIRLAGPIQKAFHKLFGMVQSAGKVHHFLFFGFLNGFLPCGLVYAALAASVVSASAMNGLLFMVCFGIGTVPSLSTVVYLQQQVSPKIKALFARSSYYLSVGIGVLLILRGIGLGIPYISPKVNAHSQQMECCEKH